MRFLACDHAPTSHQEEENRCPASDSGNFFYSVIVNKVQFLCFSMNSYPQFSLATSHPSIPYLASFHPQIYLLSASLLEALIILIQNSSIYQLKFELEFKR